MSSLNPEIDGHSYNRPDAGAQTPADAKAARRARFEKVFDQIAEELLTYVKGEGMPKDAVEWYQKVNSSLVSCSVEQITLPENIYMWKACKQKLTLQ